MKKGKNNEQKQLDGEDFEDATKYIEKYTENIEIHINLSMLPLLAPMITSEIDPDQVQYNFPDCNKNTPNRSKVCKIMYNICNNVMGVRNDHPRSLGHDGELLVMKWNKVS